MKHKDIKRIVRKQLKKQYPNWPRLTNKEKKAIARAVLAETFDMYDFDKNIIAPMEELLGIEGQMPSDKLMNLEQMKEFIESISRSKLVRLNHTNKVCSHIVDDELLFVHNLIDDEVINRLLSYDGYTPCMHDYFPSMYFRAELLKAIRYPEISYRKFCSDEYLGPDRKQNRSFIGLSLRRNKTIDHTLLSKFRSNLSFDQQLNLMVYILYHVYASGLMSDCIIHGVDSTELSNECSFPLATIEVNGKKIRIYSDINCDCGKRRNKRNKSTYVVGYRLHTLTAIDAKTGCSFPLVSLLSPANHHDSHFLKFLVKVGQAMGIELKLITADEAYHDIDGDIYRDTGVLVTTPPSAKTKCPDNVDPATCSVFFDGDCDIPMQHVGYEGQMHEYKCGMRYGDQCHRALFCPQSRLIPMDTGLFQRIPYSDELVKEAHEIRKNSERPFNLLKNQAGLETIRVRSQHSSLVRCTISSIAVLLIEMAGKRKKATKSKPDQITLFASAA